MGKWRDVRINCRLRPEDATRLRQMVEQRAFYACRTMTDLICKGIEELYRSWKKTGLERAAAPSMAAAPVASLQPAHSTNKQKNDVPQRRPKVKAKLKRYAKKVGAK